jgi:spore coat protein U-like protein
MTKLLPLLFFLMISINCSAKDCDFTITLTNSTIQVTDIDQVVQRELSASRKKKSNSSRDCTLYRVYFTKGMANSYQRKAYSATNQTINYNLHRQVNMVGILKERADALNASEYVEGTSPQKDITYQSSFFVSVPDMAEQNYPRSGSYTDNVQVSLYGFVDSKKGYVFEDSAALTLLFIVPVKINISLIDEGSAFDESSTAKILDFGFLTQYQEKGADLRVVSNTPYQIRASSTNNGNLKHTSQNALINYGMKVNGSTVSLAGSSGTPVNLGSGTNTTTAGDRFNLRFQILTNTSTLAAGLYQDQITITAIAN